MAKDAESALIARIEALEAAFKSRDWRDLDPDEEHTRAKARLANAEAERVELEVAARRRAPGSVGRAATPMPDTDRPAASALRVSTWIVLARGADRSFVLRLQDAHGRDHDFIVSATDLTGIATSAFAMAGETSYEAARLRKMIAEAVVAEAEVAALGRSNAHDDKPLVAQTWSLERGKDANGAPAFIVALKGDGRAVQAQLTGHIAATLCGRLGLMVSELLAEPRKAR